MSKKTLGTALITGGARRLGSSIALFLAEKGYNIVVHYNNSDSAAKALQKKIIKNTNVDCALMRADLRDPDQVSDLARTMKKNHKDWNLLINNASIFHKSNFLDAFESEMATNFYIHLRAPVNLSREFANHCLIKNIEGNIINMLDKNIVRSDTNYFAYLLSKKSLAEFTKMAALELAPQIRMNGIAPGFILNSIDETDKKKETEFLIPKIPMQKKGSEDDILEAIEYLLKADFVTGQILFVDGGASLNHAG